MKWRCLSGKGKLKKIISKKGYYEVVMGLVSVGIAIQPIIQLGIVKSWQLLLMLVLTMLCVIDHLTKIYIFGIPSKFSPNPLFL